MNLEHLKPIGRSDDRPHLETFRLNVLQIAKRDQKSYLTVGEILDGKETINDLSVDYSAAQTGMEQRGVSSSQCMHALERLRQLFHCNRNLYLHIYGKLCMYVKGAYFYTDNDNYSSYEKKDQWPQQFIKEINDLNANMEMQLGRALNTDIMYLRKKYKDWGCSGTEPTSKSDAINRAFDLHRNVTKGLSTLSREVIDNLIMQDTALHVLINWLNGFHTIARKYTKTDMDIDPNYALFVKQVFPDPYSARIGQQVHLNKKSVIVSYKQETALSLDNTYDLLIRPVMANGDTHTYVDQRDFMSLTKDWGLRNDWVRIFIAFNMFNLGQMR